MILRHLARRQLMAIGVCSVALVAVTWAWINDLSALQPWINLQTSLVTLLLTLAVVAAGLFPIHIRYHTKILLTTPPLYVIAVLLPAPLAALAAGVGVLSFSLINRSKQHNSLSIIATKTGRWVLVVLLCSKIADLPAVDLLSESVILALTAVLMLALDILTFSISISLTSGEPATLVMLNSLKAGGSLEVVQYFIGILAALVAEKQIWLLALFLLPTVLVYFAFKSAKEMHESTQRLLEAMADAVDLRDPYTGDHSHRVAEWCSRILQEMKISGQEAQITISAARVHDIGKIGIPDAILIKPGRLTPEERKLMEIHSDRGAELVGRYQDFRRGVEIVRHHHERWDGKGYPRGLHAYDIPFGARVIAVADSFDAMTTDRPYRAAMSVSQAVQILRDERGKQWDPQVIDTFLRVISDQLEEPALAIPARLTLGSEPLRVPA